MAERQAYTLMVAGSNPADPTNDQFSVKLNPFLVLTGSINVPSKASGCYTLVVNIST